MTGPTTVDLPSPAHRETDQPIIFCHLTLCDAHTYFPEWFNGGTEHETASKTATWSTSPGHLLGTLAKRTKHTLKIYPLKLWADNPDDTPVNVTSVRSKLLLTSVLFVSLM